MATGLYSGVSGLAIGVGLNKGVTGLWSGASGLIAGWGGGFNPLSLFAAGEPGAWYDPSDLSTMFQDTAGTTPVTATGQTVGLLLDKSQGLVLGPELVTNGDFSAGTTGWTLGTGWSIGGGVATTEAGTSGMLSTTVTVVAGRTYRVDYTITSWVSGQAIPGFAGGTVVNGPTSGTGIGTRTVFLVAATGNTTFRILKNTSADSFSIDNISVKELPGNHATQATAASRPIYGIEPFGGRRNLLTYSEDFSNGVWNALNGASKVSAASFSVNATNSRFYQSVTMSAGATYTLQFTFAAGDVGKSIRLTYFDSVNGWILTTDQTIPSSGLLTYTFTPANSATFAGIQAASTQSGTTTFTLLSGKGAQLELGSTATAYQRVTDQWNVTQAGVPSVAYLAFDGTDDFLLTGTITPGIDKAQVFAGVRKLSDAATNTFFETGPNSGTTAGSLGMFSSPNGYRFRTGGSLLVDTSVSSGYVAPITNVLTGIGDIAADTCILRINGAQIGSVALDQGTGNFLGYPLYIGRRGGTSLPFNGRIYQMLVRFGANLSAATITQTETFVNSRTGAF